MITAILIDVEGTTSSITFVKDVLFPYVRERLPAFVVTHADEPEVQHWLHDAAKEAGLISTAQQHVIDLLVSWIDEDRKSTALKALQGLIWQEGYAANDFRAHVYPEVPKRLRAWQIAGKRLYVYSSGSVLAQKLFFGHTEVGDLTALFSGYFDTETGPKRDAESYRRIAATVGVPVDEILFLSDTPEELDAAHAAGLQTTLLARAPAACPSHSAHRCVADFDSVEIV